MEMWPRGDQRGWWAALGHLRLDYGTEAGEKETEPETAARLLLAEDAMFDKTSVSKSWLSDNLHHYNKDHRAGKNKLGFQQKSEDDSYRDELHYKMVKHAFKTKVGPGVETNFLAYQISRGLMNGLITRRYITLWTLAGQKY